MNLTPLKRSRRAPAVGDIFAMQLPDGLYLYGRVISIDARPLGVPGAILIYVYRARARTKIPIPELSVHQLLIPPMMTNKRPWTMGYFELVAERPLASSDRLLHHCFADSRGWYFDEAGNRLNAPAQPVGQWGLHSYQTIDAEISQALGLPAAGAE